MTGKIWGWLGPTAAGTYSPSVTVDDLNGGQTTMSFTWEVEDTNHAPVIRPIDTAYTYEEWWTGPFGPQIEVVDIDGDPLTYSFTGLPTNITGQSDGTLTGSQSVVGFYTGSVTVSDGHGGTDTQPIFWQIYDWLIPLDTPPSVSLKLPDLTFVHPNTPVEMTVDVEWPNHWLDPVTVFLTATNKGRVSLSETQVTIDSFTTATVLVTPLAVGQKVGDLAIQAKVGGQVMAQQPMNVAGVVLPRVRATTTPASMRQDRISLGNNTPGMFTGAAAVAPAGLTNLTIDAAQKNSDAKYGKAAIGQGIPQLLLAGKGAITVYGVDHTLPTMDGSGDSDNKAGNRDGLWLQAFTTVMQANGTTKTVAGSKSPNNFSVATIGIATIAKNAKKADPLDLEPITNSASWLFGAYFDIDAVADGVMPYDNDGFPKYFFMAEQMNVVPSTQPAGMFVVSPTSFANNAYHRTQRLPDLNGMPFDMAKIGTTRRQAVLWYIRENVAKGASHIVLNQHFRFYNSAVDAVEPYTNIYGTFIPATQTHYILQSGYRLVYNSTPFMENVIVNNLARVRVMVTRTPAAQPLFWPAQPGLIDSKTASSVITFWL
jgi:hypothetical protein